MNTEKAKIPKGEKILILGTSGTIGHAVALEAAKENEVWGVARFTNPKVKKLLENAGVKCVVKNFADWDPSAVKESLKDLPADFSVVIDETLTAFNTPALYDRYPGAKAFVVTTTGQNYIGYTEDYLDDKKVFKWDENLRQPLSYWGKYGMDKVALEYFAHHYCVAKEIPTVILRYECPVATDLSLHMRSFWKPLKAVIEGKEVAVFRNLIGRPYNVIHVKDVAVASLEASALVSIPPNIFNIAGYMHYSQREILNIMAETFGKVIKYRELLAGNSIQYGGYLNFGGNSKFPLATGFNYPFIYVLDKMKKYLSEPKMSFGDMVEDVKNNGTLKFLWDSEDEYKKAMGL